MTGDSMDDEEDDDNNENAASDDSSARKKNNCDEHNGFYSAEAMKRAVAEFGEYLEPKPKETDVPDTWEEFQATNFILSNNMKKADAMFNKLVTYDVKNSCLEGALLVAETLNKSFTTNSSKHGKEYNKVLQKLFDKEKRADLTVYETMAHESIAILQKRLSEGKTCASTTALYLLTSILNLIANCRVIDTRNRYETLRKRNIDWDKKIREADELNKTLQSSELNSAIHLANEKVTRVKNTEKAKAKKTKEKRAATTVPEVKTAPSISSTIPRKSSEPLDVLHVPKKKKKNDDEAILPKNDNVISTTMIPKRASSAAAAATGEVALGNPWETRRAMTAWGDVLELREAYRELFGPKNTTTPSSDEKPAALSQSQLQAIPDN